jgi:hypothetical protein
MLRVDVNRADFGFWILDFGFWILDFGFWILDYFLVQDSAFCGREQSKIANPKSKIIWLL